MKYKFAMKSQIEISELDKIILENKQYIPQCEVEYEARVNAVAQMITLQKRRIIMVSGPSASGKTTSSLKLAIALRKLGHQAIVVSLDDFFKNIEDYPLNSEGKPDLEHVEAVDIESVNATFSELLSTGKCCLPHFDFKTQKRKTEHTDIELNKDGIVIIEGIHALNPLMAQSIPDELVFRLYVGMRAEYYQNGTRVINTRDLRITRRMVRDFKFRGRDVDSTLGGWQSISEGEEMWIKPFKPIVDMLLDTSLPYEPSVFLPILRELKSDLNQGTFHRDKLLRLCGLFELFEPSDTNLVPKSSMLREFLGELDLE